MLTIPQTGATERQVHQRIRELIEGRSNCNGTVTLAPGTTTTTVAKSTINGNAALLLFPQTANAGIEWGNGTLRGLITPGGGSFTLTHANNSQSDRTFYYVVLGG